MILDALKEYKKEVEDGIFPGEEHTFTMNREEAEKI